MHRSLRTPTLALICALTASACAESDATIATPDLPDAAELDAAAARGAHAFAQECATCHVAGHGFDLALFDFPDSTIIRRAVFHVPRPVANDIVAHVSRLRVVELGRDTPPFEVPIAHGDVDFAVRLFGSDAWPSGISEEELLAIDPSTIAAAVRLPRWSEEGSNLDWMPDTPLSDAVLDARDGWVRSLLEGYEASPTDRNAVAVANALRWTFFNEASPNAVCHREHDETIPDPLGCFNGVRWAASFGAHHTLRFDRDLEDRVAGSTRIQDAFWDVGQISRFLTLKQPGTLENDEENWVSWHWVGWMFAPQNHASTYTAGGLARAGLRRHAAFVALRSMAGRAEGSRLAPKDLATLAAHAPNEWLVDAYETGLDLLEARAERGGWPTESEDLMESDDALRLAAARLMRRVGNEAARPLLDRTWRLLTN